MKEAERRQTQVTNRRIKRRGARSTERARLTAFHRGSHLRELFHPKGSASGQASWDAVRTGVTRLRLSQSREAPPAPVIMPGDMMPKPPGNGVYGLVRGHRPRSAAGEYPQPTASLLSEITRRQVTVFGTTVKDFLPTFMTSFVLRRLFSGFN